MFAYASREAVEKTLATGQAHYYSRSRQELWHKGATSGHFSAACRAAFLIVTRTALLYRVMQTGAACHTGERSCFYRTLTPKAQKSMGEVFCVARGNRHPAP